MLKQLSVFLQNKAGRIAQITCALSDAGIDLRALSIADTADFGILRMLVSDIEGAKSALAKENCILSVNEVAVVAVPDEPGGLARILTLMAQENIDIEYMYSLVERSAEEAYMVLRVSDEPKLLQMLADNGLHSVTAEMLGMK